MEKNNNAGCLSCQADFNRQINSLVDEGKNKADHTHKQSEITAALGAHQGQQPHVENHHATKAEKNGETC